MFGLVNDLTMLRVQQAFTLYLSGLSLSLKRKLKHGIHGYSLIVHYQQEI